MYSSLQFGSVQDSIENLAAAAKNQGLQMPIPPKFIFTDDRNRVKLNWAAITAVDTDNISSNIDLKTLENLL